MLLAQSLKCHQEFCFSFSGRQAGEQHCKWRRWHSFPHALLYSLGNNHQCSRHGQQNGRASTRGPALVNWRSAGGDVESSRNDAADIKMCGSKTHGDGGLEQHKASQEVTLSSVRHDPEKTMCAAGVGVGELQPGGRSEGTQTGNVLVAKGQDLWPVMDGTINNTLQNSDFPLCSLCCAAHATAGTTLLPGIHF